MIITVPILASFVIGVASGFFSNVLSSAIIDNPATIVCILPKDNKDMKCVISQEDKNE